MKRAIVAHDRLPENFPTNFHDAACWEALGRAVATSGFLEDGLGRAIFAFTGTKQIPEDKVEEEYQKWLPTLEKALTDALASLINSYERAVRANADLTITNLGDLKAALKEAAAVRNVICHGLWGIPDDRGRSLPRFVDRKLRVFDTPIDIPYLRQLQQYTAELASAIISTVTHMGGNFLGRQDRESNLALVLGGVGRRLDQIATLNIENSIVNSVPDHRAHVRTFIPKLDVLWLELPLAA